MVELKDIIIPLTAALGLSVVVERVLEFITNVFNNFPIDEKVPVQIDKAEKDKKVTELGEVAKAGIYSAEQESKAEELAAKLDQAILDLQKAGKDEASINDDPAVLALKQQLAEFKRDREWNEAVPPNIIAWQPATAPNGERVYREIAIHAIGLAVGIGLAAYSKLELFNKFFIGAGYGEILPWVDYIFTGLLISAGSGPIHVLIKFVSERKFQAAPEEINVGEHKKDKEPAPPAATPVNELAPREKALKEADWVPIAYEGGIDREKLETVHRRKSDPNCVIIHHTAMRRDSTFEDVVRVIKSRKDKDGNGWLTGYNCVITEDGGIHPFCRWDRYGSHAAGYNSRSLGIAFNGNFETGRADAYSNHDGSYGPSSPSQKQLESGARVIALWAHIYGFEAHYGIGGTIFPHRQITAKACPGSNFPEDQLDSLIKYYYELWKKSPIATEEIKHFKNKQYLKIA